MATACSDSGSERQEPHQPAFVLIVEDDRSIRETLFELLDESGYRVDSVGNARDALERAERGPRPDVIVLDLMMPVMDGFTFLERVQSIPALARMPIVVLTAKDLTEAERRMVNERTLLVLTKGAQPLSSLGSALAAIARQPAQKVAG